VSRVTVCPQSKSARTVASSINLLAFTIKRRSRYWEVRDEKGELVCLTVYKRGAKEVVRRLAT